MRLVLSSLTFTTLISLILSQSTIDWLSDWDYNSFRTSFYLLDYNQDGVVTLNEAKLGILSILDGKFLATQPTDEYGDFSADIYDNYHTFQPSKYNCIPSIISMDFVDCLIMSVRHSTTTTEDAALDFENMLSLYFGECDDVSPFTDTDLSCSMLVKEGHDICHKQDAIYCQISCFKCANGGFMLFESQFTEQTDARLIEILSQRIDARGEITALTGEHNKHIIARKMSQQTANTITKAKGHVGRNHICPVPAKMKHINRNRFVFMSDVHIEPWYNPSGTSYISRFEDYSVDNMFECRDDDGNTLDPKTQCPLTGYSDPPINLFTSALHAWNMYARRPEESVLLFIGDMQAHSFLNDKNAIRSLMYNVMNNLLYYFEPDGIYIAPGNNDGPHNAIFTQNGDKELTDAWADVLIQTGIVNNIQMPHRKYLIYEELYDTVTLFSETGYYMKPLSRIHFNYFVIVLNTNLGSLNPTQQMAFVSDLEFVDKVNGKVVILGHHPSVMENMMPPKYVDSDIILGIFSGHIHYFAPTNKQGFTILPAMTQYAPYSAFAMSDIQDILMVDDEDDVDVGETKKRIQLTHDNVLMYIANDHQLVDSHCWQ
eukprot:180159_1